MRPLTRPELYGLGGWWWWWALTSNITDDLKIKPVSETDEKVGPNKNGVKLKVWGGGGGGYIQYNRWSLK